MGFQKNKENGSVFQFLFDFAKVFGSVAFISYLSRFVITDNQKKAVRQRDKGCGNKQADIHRGLPLGQSGRPDDTPHVHHIVTQRTCKNQPDSESPMPDFAENLLSLCPECHLGDEDGFTVVHPDMYFVRAYSAGTLASANKKRITQHKECYDFFVAYAKRRDDEIRRSNARLPRDQQKAILPRDDGYKAALSAWRAHVFLKGEIYWNSDKDGIFQGSAIRRSRDARKKGWKYPLIEINRSDKVSHWGEQIWTNMVIFLIEEYLQRLKPEDFENIVGRIENAEFSQKYLGLTNPDDHTSRAIMYQNIYLPAIQNFMPGPGVPGMIQSYINTQEPEACKAVFSLMFRAEKKNNRKLAFMILKEKFYKPALQLHADKEAKAIKNKRR